MSSLSLANESFFMKNRFYKYYVGIDIGYRFHEACCIPFGTFMDEKQSWKKVKTLNIMADGRGANQLFSYLEKYSTKTSEFCVLMEATSGYYGFLIMKALEQKGYEILLVESKAVKDFREKNLGMYDKTDKIDAKVMGYMAFQKGITPSTHGIRFVGMSSPSQMVCKHLASERWSLQRQLNRRKNQLQQFINVTHPELKNIFTSGTARPAARRLVLKYPTAALMANLSQEQLFRDLIEIGAKCLARKKITELVKLLKSNVVLDVPHFVDYQSFLIEDIERLEALIKRLDEQIKVIVDEHPYKEILWSLPIMGYTWACTLIGVIGDVNRFLTYKKFKRYLGFTPQNRESGISLRSSHLCFNGVRHTRRVLFQMALTMVAPRTRNNPFCAYYVRLLDRNMPKRKALGHVAGKLAQVMYGCLKYNRLYDPTVHSRQMLID